jgi:hypothetical protein
MALNLLRYDHRSQGGSLYRELRRRAAAYLRHERPHHTLQPTALVHEAYVRNMVKVHEAQSPRHKLDLEPWILSLVRGRHP